MAKYKLTTTQSNIFSPTNTAAPELTDGFLGSYITVPYANNAGASDGKITVLLDYGKPISPKNAVFNLTETDTLSAVSIQWASSINGLNWTNQGAAISTTGGLTQTTGGDNVIDVSGASPKARYWRLVCQLKFAPTPTTWNMQGVRLEDTAGNIFDEPTFLPSFNPAIQWYVKGNGGSNNNGGGFTPVYGGSRIATPIVANANVIEDKMVASYVNGIIAGQSGFVLGNVVNITAGSGVTAGRYLLIGMELNVTVDGNPETVWYLDRLATTAGISTSLSTTSTLGGELLNQTQIATAMSAFGAGVFTGAAAGGGGGGTAPDAATVATAVWSANARTLTGSVMATFPSSDLNAAAQSIQSAVLSAAIPSLTGAFALDAGGRVQTQVPDEEVSFANPAQAVKITKYAGVVIATQNLYDETSFPVRSAAQRIAKAVKT